MIVILFNSYRSFVSEDAGPNTLVATVSALDPDGDGVAYDIPSGNQKGNFVVDPKKGNNVLALCCYSKRWTDSKQKYEHSASE